MYVRFGGERLETYRRDAARRWALTLLMSSVAPIPFATMISKEHGNMGQNFLRSLFALGFQGFFLMVCVGIYAVLVNDMIVSDNVNSAMFMVAAYTVILVFAMMKSGSLAKSVFNAS